MVSTKYVYMITGTPAYKSKFDLYLAFATWMQLTLSFVESVICFLEFMAQQGSRAHTLMAYVSVMKHFFQLYDLDISVLDHRKIKLLIKSFSMNSVYTPKFKANFTPSLLKKLHLLVIQCYMVQCTNVSSFWHISSS